MAKRFQKVQTFEEFTDYDTQLGGNELPFDGNETVRRLTIVSKDGKPVSAYLTLIDYETKDITLEEAKKLLAEEETN